MSLESSILAEFVFYHKFSFSLISSSSLPALMKHKDGWPFDRPITKQDAPDYHLCVKTPIDLSTIRFVHIRYMRVAYS